MGFSSQDVSRDPDVTRALLAQNDNLSIHEDKARGVYVKGLTDVYVGSETDVYRVMKAGGASRATSSTSIFCLHIIWQSL